MKQYRFVYNGKETRWLILATAIILLTTAALLAVQMEETDASSSGKCGDGLIWTLDDDGNLSIAGSGNMTNYDGWNRAPWGTKIKSLSIGNSVTTIGSGAFYNCRSLKSVDIPDSVTTIGGYAFENCKSLKSVDIPDSVSIIDSHAFYCCTSLTSVDIPDSVTTIGGYAFENCKSLKSVTIGDSVETIEEFAFYCCTQLASVTIGKSVATIGESALICCNYSVNPANEYYKSVDGFLLNKSGDTLLKAPNVNEASIPDSVTTIGDDAFSDCSSLTSVNIPDSVSIIDSHAFYCCTSLTSVDIPDSVTTIGDSAFSRCSSLASVAIPDSVKSIRNFAFYNCTSLTSVVIPDSVKSIRNSAFNSCTSLTSVVIPDSVTSIGDYAFHNCTSLASVIIGKSVTSIHTNSFSWCTSLASFTVDPANMSYSSVDGLLLNKTIKTLIAAPNLIQVVIPDSVTSIGDYALCNSESLTSIAIPDSVTSIGYRAFPYGLFHDGKGQEIKSSADNLSGYVFERTGEVLKRTGYYENRIVSDGLKYKIESIDAEYATLVGYDSAKKRLAVPETVERGGHEYKVTSIGPKAFYGCSELRSVDLGSVSEIGMKAFARCRMLASVNAGDPLESIGSYAFYNCVRLRTLDLGDSVDDLKTIGAYAMFRCNIDSISIPSDIKRIGKGGLPRSFADEDGNPLEKTMEALAGYTYSNVDGVLVRQPGPEIGAEYSSDGLLYRVVKTLPAELELIGYEGSLESVSVPETVEFDGFSFTVPSIGYAAFRGCRTLASIDMPGVESIGVKAFANCTNLSSVTLGDELRTVSAYAFYGCRSLVSFDAPDSLKIVGSYAFYRCSSLEEIDLGSSLTTIGAESFASCPAVSMMSIPQTLSRVRSDAFGDLTFMDVDGNDLPKTAEALRGHVYAGSDGVLQATS